MGALAAWSTAKPTLRPSIRTPFGWLRKYRPDLVSAVRVLGETAPTPIPPLVASAGSVSEKETRRTAVIFPGSAPKRVAQAPDG